MSSVRRVSGIVTPHAATRRQRLTARVICAMVRACAATQRFTFHDPTNARALCARGPVIFAVWHNRLALAPAIYQQVLRNEFPDRRLAALISASRDGALLACIIENFGMRPVRGSTSRRGPQALLELTSCAEQGFDIAITPDGPRGPRYKVQPGVIAIARLTGRPIVPLACNARRKSTLRSWDRFQIPHPFGRCEIRIAQPMIIPAEEDDSRLESWRAELERRLLEVTLD